MTASNHLGQLQYQPKFSGLETSFWLIPLFLSSLQDWGSGGGLLPENLVR
ncbi:hypothetical protein CGRA01v4_10049 [Colletotrichum graminicola]|nr:hypothetical protein CGRA01v4_10049 [Colletotrichum graminicola]